MIFSWALVEVPRYLFYIAVIVTGDATGENSMLGGLTRVLRGLTLRERLWSVGKSSVKLVVSV